MSVHVGADKLTDLHTMLRDRVPSSVWSGDLIDATRASGVEIIELAGGPIGLLPDHVLDAGAKAARVGGREPTLGNRVLIEAIGAKLERENMIGVGQSGVVVTNGAMHGLFLVLHAYLSAGDEVLIPAPGFFLDGLVRQVGGVPVCVPTSEASGYHVDFERLQAAVTHRTRAVMLINPGNPTGAVWSSDELDRLAAFAQKNDLLVIADEAYERFVFDGRAHLSLGAWPEVSERTLTVHSFTKSYGLRASRIGYVAGGSKLIEPVVGALDWTSLACNPVSQAMAYAALTGPQEWLSNAAAEIEGNRNVVEALVASSTHITAARPEGGTFVFLRVLSDDIDVESFCWQLITSAGVPVVPGGAFAGGTDYRRHIRLPIGGNPKSVTRAVGEILRLAGEHR